VLGGHRSRLHVPEQALQPYWKALHGNRDDGVCVCVCVCVCRRAVQHRVSAAAANQSSGGTMLHEYPDFILPFIIQSLAHHPDFPTPEVTNACQPLFA